MTHHTNLIDLVRRFEDSWNNHDMTSFGQLFHANATFVNRFGVHWRGVDEIVAGHAAIHSTIYSDSTLAIDPPDIEMIGDYIAILHFWTRLSAGAAHPAGPHDADTLILAVMLHRNGEWRIKAAENVTFADPQSGLPILR